MCFNSIEVEKLINQVGEKDVKALIKMLKGFILNNGSFEETKETIRRIINDKKALEYIKSVCPQLAAFMVFKIEADDKINNPLRQPTNTKKPPKVYQRKPQIAVAVSASH
jgi:hypothetical protein